MEVTIQNSEVKSYGSESLLSFSPLPLQRPLLMVGHGTRDNDGRQTFLDFVDVYQSLDTSRPVVPCFLELTEPTILEGIELCLEKGYTEFSVLPVLLFAARHNKFDITNELDRAQRRYPQLKFHYGRHFGISPGILDLWRSRLAELDNPDVKRSETVILFVGRGSSDPDANGDVYKMARMLWEGSGFLTVETCFIGITHPRLEEGFRRARLYEPKRIIVLPYFLFTGALVKKIYGITADQQAQFPEIEMVSLPEMGIARSLLEIVREREIETQLGQVQMNCEMCKFRLAAVANNGQNHSHEHGHGHAHQHHKNGHSHDHHSHGHSHDHSDAPVDPYADSEQHHQRIWQAP